MVLSQDIVSSAGAGEEEQESSEEEQEEQEEEQEEQEERDEEAGGIHQRKSINLQQENRNKGNWLEHGFIFGLMVGGAIVFLVMFSDLPYCQGDELFKILSSHYDKCLYALSAAVFFTFLLFVLDVRFWSRGIWRIFALLLMAATVLGFAVAALLATKAYVVAPVGLFLFGSPFFMMGLKQTVFKHMDIIAYLRTLEISLVTVGAMSLTFWLLWIILDDNWWSLETKIDFYSRMECNVTALEATLPGYENETQLAVLLQDLSEEDINRVDNQVVIGCTSAFFLWLIPFILALWATVFAGVLFFLIRALVQARDARKKKKNAMDPIAQMFLMFIGLGLFGLWAAAGIAGSSMSLTTVILALAFVGFIIGGVVIVAVLGSGVVQEGLQQTPLGLRMLKLMHSDWVKAIGLMLISPFFLIYLAMAILTQFFRKNFTCTKHLEDEEKKTILTTRASRYTKQIKKWNWTSVLVKSLWIGIAYFLLSVGVIRVTTLFLSWLNEQLLTIPLVATTFIFFAVGILMFLNPLIPGVPVYLSGGVILVNAAEEDLGFAGACMFTIAICFLLKMLAIIMQQKVIGEKFASKKVWIRRFVGVNSLEIRAIKKILLVPGMNLRKVSVLCGGPDWPVSVLTGILRLNLCSMLYGSLPIIFLIAPTVLAGAFLLKTDAEGPWESISTMTLALTVIVQSGAMLAAIHFIAKTIVENEEELKSWPDDEEVLEHERKTEARAQLRARIMHWRNLDWFNKIMLIISAVAMTASCYIFQLFSGDCFVAFEVNDSISVELEGDARNLVKPLGFYNLLVFVYPCVYLYLFNTYIRCLVNDAERHQDENGIGVTVMQSEGQTADDSDDDDDDDDDDSDQDEVEDEDEEARTQAIKKKACIRFLFPCF